MKNLKNITKDLNEQLLLIKGVNYELIGEYFENDTHINIKHNECNNLLKVEINKLKDNGCIYCSSRNKSKLSLEFEQLLIRNNINHKTEVRFSNCRSKKELPFDFGVYNCKGELLFLVEIDGLQHTFKVDIFGDVRGIQQRDGIKDKYCKENNIILHRISYLEYCNRDGLFESILKGVKSCNNLEKVSNQYSEVTLEMVESIREVAIYDSGETISSFAMDYNIPISTVIQILRFELYPDIMDDAERFIRRKFFKYNQLEHFKSMEKPKGSVQEKFKSIKDTPECIVKDFYLWAIQEEYPWTKNALLYMTVDEIINMDCDEVVIKESCKSIPAPKLVSITDEVIAEKLSDRFKIGSFVSYKIAKEYLSKVYKELEIGLAPKASELEKYFFVCTASKKIEGKKIAGYNLLSNKFKKV